MFSTSTTFTYDPSSLTFPSVSITIVIGEASLLYPLGCSVSVRRYVFASSPWIVNLPEDETVAALIVYGYEDGPHQAPNKRKDVDEIMRFVDR